jgi:S-adenosylmethionine synthetase
VKHNFMFTSESVTEGHPDKLCDVISDAILDDFLRQDPLSRVITECAASRGVLFLAARFASRANLNVAEVARQMIGEIGYRKGKFSVKQCTIITSLSEMSVRTSYPADLNQLNDEQLNALVATNQVTVFGFACTQTPNLMPLPIYLAHELAQRLSVARRGLVPYISPDGKTQVGVEYQAGQPSRIHSITLLAGQKKSTVGEPQQLYDDLMAHVIQPVFENETVKPDAQTRIFINPEGPWIGGGPAVHSGLTGRKTAIDTYGEYARHSGAALSGKDPLRIDRSGAYAARYAAKNVVAAGLAEECEVQLSYSIGLARPVSVQVQTFGTGKRDEDEIAQRLIELIDFRLGSIVRDFDLLHLPSCREAGFYRRLAVYGHMGRTELDLPWEQTDKAGLLR